MFTGIIEAIGEIVQINKRKNNLSLSIKVNFLTDLYKKQSIAVNGVCLTIEEKNDSYFQVTAIEETLEKTNFLSLKKGDKVNLERALLVKDRFDGHIVQGHIDCVGICSDIKTKKGSWVFEFTLKNYSSIGHLIINKGSIAINGISLTIKSKNKDSFKVAIIPYTYKHTILNNIKKGESVNIEYDILGKYIANSK